MEKELIEDYLKEGGSIAGISRKYNISTYRVRKILIKNNIKIKTQKELLIERKFLKKYHEATAL